MAVGLTPGRAGEQGPAPGNRVERRVYVRASPRHVWATLHDPGLTRDLLAELSLGPADPSWPAAGSVRHGEVHLGLLRTAIRVESLEARPQTAFRLVVDAASFSIAWGWRLEAVAGGTRVIHDGTFDTSDRWTGVLVRLGRESVGSLVESHLRALKERAEIEVGEAAGPAA